MRPVLSNQDHNTLIYTQDITCSGYTHPRNQLLLNIPSIYNPKHINYQNNWIPIINTHLFVTPIYYPGNRTKYTWSWSIIQTITANKEGLIKRVGSYISSYNIEECPRHIGTAEIFCIRLIALLHHMFFLPAINNIIQYWKENNQLETMKFVLFECINKIKIHNSVSSFMC